MMDDNSEAQMETDVSSTTAGGPEVQKVTGSNGDMNMVIVVVKIQEEHSTSNVQEQLYTEQATSALSIQSVQDSEDKTSSSTDPQDKKLLEVIDKADKLPEGQENTVETEKQDKSPAKLVQLSLTSNDISSKALLSPVHMQSVGEITDSSSKNTSNLQNKNIMYSEKANQLGENRAIDDHQYAAKSCSIQMEQSNLELKEVSSEVSNGDYKEDSNKSKDNNATSKMDEGAVPLEPIDKENVSDDSQTETSSEISEKDQNRSISRELKSLINSAKESKIISECTQLTSKTRKSRTPLDNANTSLTSLVEAEKIQVTRRNSTNSQKSSCSEKSDKFVIKRSMRSQNPEFVNKVKQFLNSVTGKVPKPDTETLMSDDETDESKIKDNNDSSNSSPKNKKMLEQASDKTNKLRCDPYCWRCHWPVEQVVNEKTHHPMQCTVCPRSFHFKCLSGTERNKITTDKNWVCPECLSVLHAESSETRSPAMKKISLGVLCELLNHALERMMDLNGVEPFMHPVDRTAFPDYDKYVVHPMDLTHMKNNINEGLYGSTEAFIADVQWILHNSIIFNTLQSKLTGGARALVRSCRAEMGEIEACPECYAAAHAHRPTWFTDVCSTPHVLLWAKLKGFPHWPAKGMSVNSSGLVDVRFFGAHDRAWVPAKDCYLYSEKDPNNFRTKRQDILDSMQEAEQHIRNISRKYGKFVYPPFKTQFDPSKLADQIKMMIPSFDGEVRSFVKEKSGGTPQSASKDKSRSNSKSSKSSINDGDMSEGEDSRVTPTRKMADGAEIAKEEEDFSISDKNKMDIDMSVQKSENFRKRRRSDLEEAVITILDTSGSATTDKRRRVEDVISEAGKTDDDSKEKKKALDKSTDQIEKAFDQLKKVTTDKEPPNVSNDVEKLSESTPAKSRVKPISRTSTPKDSAKDKNNIERFSTPKQRAVRVKSTSTEKEEKSQTHRRRNSKHKSANGNSEKSDKSGDKRADKSTDTPVNGREKRDSSTNKTKDSDADKNPKKSVILVRPTTDSPKSKERKADDEKALADLSRESKGIIISNSTPGLPTISSVRSLSVITSDTNTRSTKTDEVSIDVPSDSSVFTPTSTESVRNMREAVNKLQKLRSETDPPPVGRVGVRAFARITSPEQPQRDKEPMQVEIKSEPMDIEDTERQSEKLDLMSAFKLRPVNPPVANNLREVRINKVVVAPLNAKKTNPKQPEIRDRAKKTFPQPKKPEDGRSELNGKNSMVYIPIQPPTTQAPVRGVRPVAVNSPTNPTTPRPPAPITTSSSGVNTVTSPQIPHSLPSSSSNPGPTTTVTSNSLATMPSTGQLPTVGPMPTGGQIPTVGQVPTNVHTVPLITSVNGQWTFSLQPIMSVGDDTSTPPLMNGLAERGNAGPVIPLPAHIAHLGALASSALSSAAASASTTAPPIATPVNVNLTQGNRNDTPAELPRLQQRPPLLNPLDARTPIGCVPTPSNAGPLTAKLNQNAIKLTDFFRTLLEDSLEKIDEPASHLTAVKLQLEQARWRHQQEINEIKHNHELVLAEMRASFEKEKIRAVNEVRRASQVELETAVKLAKSKQWCANCSQEAQFYCCWNTSYCDYPCQRAHWTQHYGVCTQKRRRDSNTTAENGAPNLDNTIQPPDSLPKATQAPALTVGNKVPPLRVFSQLTSGSSESANGPKSSIIVSMVEDSTGNQTMKCVGTYKPQAPQQLSPLNINKQIMSSDESAKKVVTSGGYLIVGAGAASGGNIVTSRRTHTIQYYT